MLPNNNCKPQGTVSLPAHTLQASLAAATTCCKQATFQCAATGRPSAAVGCTAQRSGTSTLHRHVDVQQQRAPHRTHLVAGAYAFAFPLNGSGEQASGVGHVSGSEGRGAHAGRGASCVDRDMLYSMHCSKACGQQTGCMNSGPTRRVTRLLPANWPPVPAFQGFVASAATNTCMR